MTMTERTRDQTATLSWEPPGPGFWLLDDSHVTQVTTRYFMEVLTEICSDPETWKGFRDYGLLLAGFTMGAANGYLYVRLRIAGAPDKPGRGGPLPASLLKLLLSFHPELRYRKQRATETFATKRWRQDRARWRQELAPAFRQRLLAIQQVDPAILDDASLREHLHAVRKALVEGYQLHFSLLPADRVPVGDWMRRTCEWTGITPAEALQVLRGRAQASLAPLTLLDRLAETVRRSEAALSILHDARSNASDQMIRMRKASPEVAAALDAYLRDYGDRLVTGYDLCDLTLRELPHALLGSILAQVPGAEEQSAEVQEAGTEERAAQLRDRVPVARRAEYDALFEEASLVYGLGDENDGTHRGSGPLACCAVPCLPRAGGWWSVISSHSQNTCSTRPRPSSMRCSAARERHRKARSWRAAPRNAAGSTRSPRQHRWASRRCHLQKAFSHPTWSESTRRCSST